jgi:large conductance mechanosensitive channel
VLFLVVKAYNRTFPRKESAVGPSEIDLLAEIRDELRRR